ncbi:MAG: hypothetical protein A2X94_04215 [Bdellovibrionales bacterium GWB1_55_8]|nr:MAG: hypothetical protein A2X94_04215 [Bdellovibrionales bacterium GWB1_55_8]
MEFVLTNVLQGLVALVWVSGLQRVAGPLSAAFRAASLEMVLVVPLFASVARLFFGTQMQPESALVRVQAWLARMLNSEAFLAAFVVLVAGSALIFLLQEAIPVWKRARALPRGEAFRDQRLEQALERVIAGFQGYRRWRGRVPYVFRLESSESIASLHGILTPRILISSALMSKLDDQELDAVLAHELAHVAFGGNPRTILLWAVRAIQVLNPAALIAFRGILELRERACDELAAAVTGRPAALASALLKVQERGAVQKGARAFQRARAEVSRKIAIETTRGRVRALLDTPVEELRSSASRSRFPRLATFIMMLLILWGIR